MVIAQGRDLRYLFERRWFPSGLIARPVTRSVWPSRRMSSTASSLFMRRSHRLQGEMGMGKGGNVGKGTGLGGGRGIEIGKGGAAHEYRCKRLRLIYNIDISDR